MPTIYNKVVIDGVTKIDLSQDTVTEAGHILTGHTGHLANGNQVSGTGSGGGTSEFVITLTKNANNLWETNKTFAEITTAYGAGNILRVAAQNPGSGSDFSCETYCEYDNTDSTPNFYYQITWFDYDDDIDNGDFFEDTYILDANGLTLSDRQTYGTLKTLVSKTITANGTYNPILTDSADGYSSVTVNVPIGVDIPIFTIIRNSETEEITSITCNKTFAECDTLALADQSVVCADNYFGADFGYRTGGNVDMHYDNRIVYLVDSFFTEITFNSDGTITWAEPSSQIKDSSSLTVSGATVTAPAGFYGSDATKSVASGTEGTPTAIKGTVSNHSITVTPSVTNTTGYITGGTKTGTAVTVSASELVSGSETKTANDTYDVTNLAELVVNVPTGTARSSSDLTVSGATVTVPAGLYSTQATKSVASGSAGTPTASKGTVSNHSITVTPSVTNTTGYITGGTKTGTGVTVSANELVSGSQTISANGTVDVTNLASVNVALTFSTITTSSSSPTGGSNGDIWIKTN